MSISPEFAEARRDDLKLLSIMNVLLEDATDFDVLLLSGIVRRDPVFLEPTLAAIRKTQETRESQQLCFIDIFLALSPQEKTALRMRINAHRGKSAA